MKKKNKIIIPIAVIVIAIIVAIVGITVNNHQNAVKEAEAISVSVETSKNDLISDYQKQYQTIISAEYKTETEYNSAKKSLSALKDEIVKSDVKDNETIISLVKDIDNTIKNYDDKIKSLTSTTTTESTTKEKITTTTKTNVSESTTKKVTQKNTTKTTKSNGNSFDSNKTTKPNTTKSTTKKQATTKKHTSTKKTTTKSTKNDPPYGTVKTSSPNKADYSHDGWYWSKVKFTWHIFSDEANDGVWIASTVGGGKLTGQKYEEWKKYAMPVLKPTEPGKKNGDETKPKEAWVWLD